MRIDLHTHSAVSDGTDAPADLVRAAERAGLDVIALTDHDTMDGIAEAVATGEEVGVHVVAGMEVSTRFRGRSVHLLAYGADITHPGLAAELTHIRAGRDDRLGPVLAKLAELGVPVTREQVMTQVGGSPSIGRPHIADALVAAGHVADRTEAFDRYLADGGPAHVPRYAVELTRGIDLVREAGGVTVLAHPWGRSTGEVMTPDVIRMLAYEHHLDGIEVDHQDHDAAAREQLRTLAGDLGLLPTGSSDHHGLGKVDHELGCNTTDPDVYAELMGRLKRS
ncbi:PHP domain-containing protein [Propionibacteriaceae bacterium Y2011]|uniref:PHP domain-containing protein n=1 Tax=Microlunatus sp. Y2014 TaxID=3418488 RepID=UPI003B4FDFAB